MSNIEQPNISKASQSRTDAYATAKAEHQFSSDIQNAVKRKNEYTEATIKSYNVARKELETLKQQHEVVKGVISGYEEEIKVLQHEYELNSGNVELQNEYADKIDKISSKLKVANEYLVDQADDITKLETVANTIGNQIGEQDRFYANVAESARKAQQAQQDEVNILKERLELSKAVLEDTSGNYTAEEKAQAKIDYADAREGLSDLKAEGSTNTGSGFINTFMQSLAGKKGEFQQYLPEISKAIKKLPGGNTVVAILDGVMAMRNQLNNIVDNTANLLSGIYGAINANLEGSKKNYDSLTSKMTEAIGLSGLLKQTDYLNEIKNLTAQGLNREVEQLATLDLIKSKTVSTFDTLDSNLLRIMKLQTFGQNNTAALMFGMENLVKIQFNKLYEDTTYLSSVYDAITGAVLDALSESKNSDNMKLYSAIQSWMGTLYEKGVSSGTVEKLAQSINYLGSGNISALSSNKDMENLILLAMDRVGMNFADILQQGLNASDVNTLMSSVVSYLDEVYNKTTKNNVLTSAYTNLFGMSVSDIKAISQIDNSIAAFTVSTGNALAAAADELNQVSKDRTLVAERIDNISSNAKFDFGNQIVSNDAAYTVFKASSLVLDFVKSINNVAGEGPLSQLITKKITGLVAAPATLAYLGTVGYGALGLAKAIPGQFMNVTGQQNPLVELAGINSAGSGSAAGAVKSALDGVLGNFNQTTDENGKTTSTYTDSSGQVIDMSNWEEEASADDDVTKILKELEKTLMQCTLEEGESKYAIAVSLQGMSDEVLRSFASIFADEDAMEDTFSGKNNVLKDALFNYADDGSTTTNNSNKKTATKKKESNNNKK